jgi:hypothetical protein
MKSVTIDCQPAEQRVEAIEGRFHTEGHACEGPADADMHHVHVGCPHSAKKGLNSAAIPGSQQIEDRESHSRPLESESAVFDVHGMQTQTKVLVVRLLDRRVIPLEERGPDLLDSEALPLIRGMKTALADGSFVRGDGEQRRSQFGSQVLHFSNHRKNGPRARRARESGARSRSIENRTHKR